MIQRDLIDLINEVQDDLEDLMFGNLEFFVQDGKITQYTIRRIKKTGNSTGIKIGRKTEHQEVSYQKDPISKDYSTKKINVKLGS